MKPLGTITMCFPHVDGETRSVLQSLMEEAENFSDFSSKLVNKVCSEPSSPLLEYFAFFFAYHIDDLSLTDKMEVAGNVPDLAEPLRLIIRIRRGNLITWNEMSQAVTKALEVSPNDWITSHFYLLWRFHVEGCYAEVDLDLRTIETITESVNNNKDLEFFKLYLLAIKAAKSNSEGKIKENLHFLKEALIIARKHDDQILVSSLLNIIANRTKHFDVNRAIDLLLSARETSERLGYRYNIGNIQHQLGHILGLRGETSAAIDYQIEYQNILESFALPTKVMDTVIAFYYNQIGNGEKALEFVTRAIEKTASIRVVNAFTYIQMAWAFINLDRLDEAKDKLMIAHELTIKSGSPNKLMYYRGVEGLLDKAEQRFDAAIECFKEVLRFLEEDPVPLWLNISLLTLVEIEIELLTDESLEKKSDSSGPWMMRLIEHAEKNHLPGIAARALLLKAKLRQRQGQYDEVRKLLKEVQKAAESTSMRYLNDMAISMFPDIIVT
ncbi:MAG: hypothetical protein ACFFEE_13720 [Candidatus Thorarchaeota archaeon]